MFKNKSTDTGSNFWISYADLMAGLLFVFILLIGAIVSKSIILKSDLIDKKIKINNMSATLSKSQALVGEKSKYLDESKKTLTLKKDEIKKLNKMLLDANTQQDFLSKKIFIVQNLLNETNATLGKRNKSLREYEGKVVILSDQLTETNKTVQQKDEMVLKLLNALDEKATRYDTLVDNLQKQKAKIKSLTGIKLKVVAALKEELGNNIAIDKKSGSLRLASNILFDRGSAELKVESKSELKQAFEEYIGALITNPKIRPHIDRIIIEGHTDSDGGYLYNLNLSQKRAFAVMNFLLASSFVKVHNIETLMTASGRAYLDSIVVNGKEDKDASRRIEIKFRLKNEDAMEEIEKILDAE